MRERSVVSWLAPAALAAVALLPRLVSPQFGLLDDGFTLHTARELSGRWGRVLTLIPETGRFFPASWLVYSAVFELAGVRPLAFFAFNVLLLTALLTILTRLVRVSGGRTLAAVVAAVVFASCGPVVETFYTLSKPEPLQLTWIGLSLLATIASVKATRRARRAGSMALAVATSTLAYTSKETSVVLVPIALAWAAIARRSSAATEQRCANTWVVVNVVAASVFFGLRWWCISRPLAEGTYTRAYALHPATIGPGLFRLCAWVVRDFPFLLPLVLVAVLFAVRGPAARRREILYACAWMVGWLAVYVPWAATFEYYLLPFAFGVAGLAGIVVENLWTLRGRPHGVTTRRLAWTALTASGLLWLGGAVNAVADARVQLAVDRANADLVGRLALLPSGSRIVVNSSHLNEYVLELPRHLVEIEQRPDLVVQHIARSARGRDPGAGLFVATATIANPPRPTVRIGLDETGVNRDLARLTEMRTAVGDLVYANARHVVLVEVGFHRLLCRLATSDATYCPGDRGIVRLATFTYGWNVHRLLREPPA